MEMTNILLGLSLLTSTSTLITFVLSRRKEAEQRGARQADLDSNIREIKDSVASMARQIVNQQQLIDNLRVLLELLLQQHNNNHGQEIRRAT